MQEIKAVQEYHRRDNTSPVSDASGTGSKLGGIGHLSEQMRQSTKQIGASMDRMRGASNTSTRGPQELAIAVAGTSVFVNGLTDASLLKDVRDEQALSTLRERPTLVNKKNTIPLTPQPERDT